jgi:hypothetical protein
VDPDYVDGPDAREGDVLGDLVAVYMDGPDAIEVAVVDIPGHGIEHVPAGACVAAMTTAAIPPDPNTRLGITPADDITCEAWMAAAYPVSTDRFMPTLDGRVAAREN